MNKQIYRFLFAIFTAAMPAVAQQVEQPITVNVRFDFKAITVGGLNDHPNEPNLCLTMLAGDFHSGSLFGGGIVGAGPHTISNTKHINVPVGRLVNFTTSNYNIDEWEMVVSPPPGYLVVINSVPEAYYKAENLHMPDEWTEDTCTLIIIPADFTGMPAGEVDQPQIGNFIWNIGLGYAVNGRASGHLGIRESEIGKIWKRESLRLLVGQNAPMEYHSDSEGIRRIRTDILVDVEDIMDGNDAVGYTIRFYKDTDVALGQPLDGGNVLINPQEAIPWRRIEVEKTESSKVELRVYHNDGDGEILRTLHEVEFVAGEGSTGDTWKLKSGDSDGVIREIVHAFNPSKSQATIEVKQGESIVRRNQKNYTTVAGILDIQTNIADEGGKNYTTQYIYNSTNNWLQSVQYPDGRWERSTYDIIGRPDKIYRPYKDSSSSPVTWTNGEVVTFTYGQSPLVEPNLYDAMQNWDDIEFWDLPTSVVTTLSASNRTVSRTELQYNKSTQLNGKTVLETERKEYASTSAFYTSIERRYTRLLDGNQKIFANLPVSETRPDGTMTVWLHQPGDFDPGSTPSALDDFSPSASSDNNNRFWRTIVFHGRTGTSGTVSSFGGGPGNAIDAIFMEQDRSTIEVTVRGRQGRVIRRELYFFIGTSPSSASDPAQYQLVDWEQQEWSAANGYRLVSSKSIRTPDGWNDVENTYSGGRLTTSRNDIGQLFEFEYDALGRTVRETLLDDSDEPERSTLYWHNAAGDLVAQAVVPGKPDPLPEAPGDLTGNDDLVTLWEYDLGGRRTKETRPDSGEWRFEKQKVGNFYRELRTETDVPDSSDLNSTMVAYSVERIHFDGRPQSVTGNRVIEEHFSYNVLSSGNQQTTVYTGGPSSQRWRQVTTDWLGRELEHRSPRFTGGNLVTTYSWYASGNGGNSGKLQKVEAPGKNPLLYEYDKLGELEREGLDHDGDGFLTLASTDRIVEHESRLVQVGSVWYFERSAYGFPNNNDDTTKILLSRTRERLTGFASASVPRYDGSVEWVRAEVHHYDINDDDDNPSYAVWEREFVDPGSRKVWRAQRHRGESWSRMSMAENGLLRETISEANVRIAYEYDALRRHKQTISRDSGGHKVVEKIEYGDQSPLIKRRLRTRDSAEPNHLVAEYGYFGNGWLSSVKNLRYVDGDPDPVLEDGDPDPVLEELFTRYAYNPRGQKTHRWGSATTPVKFVYNEFGERTEMHTYTPESNWDGATIPTGLNAPGRKTKWLYHVPTGLMTERRDPLYDTDNARKETFTYDAAHRLHVHTRARGVSISHNYHAQTGQLSGKVYSDSTPNLGFTYSRLGAKHEVTDATGTRTFNYRDEDRRLDYELLSSSFYGSGRRVTTTYDNHRRKKNGVQFGLSSNNELYYRTRWTWSNARVTQVVTYRRNSSLARSFVYKFSSGSNLVREYWTPNINGQTYRLNRDWRAHENRLSEVNNHRNGFSYAKYEEAEYNELGKLVSITGKGEIFMGFGAGDKLKMNYSYTANGRLSEADALVFNGSNTFPLESRTRRYQYDHAGNRTGAGITSAGTTSGYLSNYEVDDSDALTEIAAADHDFMSGTVSGAPYIFDNERNMWLGGEVTKPGGGNVWEHIFDTTVGNNTSNPYERWFWFGNPYLEWQQWMYPKQVRSPEYDLDGNLIFDDYLFYIYDAENRPIQIVRWGVDQYEFKYDYMGRRVETRYSTGVWGSAQEQWTRRYVYDGWQIIAEIDATTGVSGLPVTTTYFWGYDITNTMGGAGGIGGLLLVDHDGDRYLPGYDLQGNVVTLVSEATGAMVAGLEYDPYGRIVRMQGDVGKIPFRWQTKWDLDFGTETSSQFSWGLYDYGLRFYQPEHGRFINRDPIREAGGLNLYEAFGGDPVNNWDLLGLDLQGREVNDRSLSNIMVPNRNLVDHPVTREHIFPWQRFENQWEFFPRPRGVIRNGRVVFVGVMLGAGGGSGSESNPIELPPFTVVGVSIGYRSSGISPGTSMSLGDFTGLIGRSMGTHTSGGLHFVDNWGIGFEIEGGIISFGKVQNLNRVNPSPAQGGEQPSFFRRIQNAINRNVEVTYSTGLKGEVGVNFQVANFKFSPSVGAGMFARDFRDGRTELTFGGYGNLEVSLPFIIKGEIGTGYEWGSAYENNRIQGAVDRNLNTLDGEFFPLINGNFDFGVKSPFGDVRVEGNFWHAIRDVYREFRKPGG